MWEWLTGVAYYAHGYCLSWDPWLIAFHALSDLLIFASYTAIPVAILIFLRRRPGLQLRGLGRFFAAFIFWCGLTHLVSMLTLWMPIYDIEAAVKVMTAGISIVTAVVIFSLIPQALAIPSPAALQLANDRLIAEIAAHQKTMAELKFAGDELEMRVVERTASLERAAQHAETLVREIAHRSGNLMSIIAAMARQTAKTSRSPEELADQLAGRIEGMGRSHKLLFQESWNAIDLKRLITEQITPFVGSHPLEMKGPAVRVSPQPANVLGMAFYELATNALKYGALSNEKGSLSIQWGIKEGNSDDQEAEFWLTWSERGGPPVRHQHPPGWGTRVLTHMTASSVNGRTSMEFGDVGLTWTLYAPAKAGNIEIAL